MIARCLLLAGLLPLGACDAPPEVADTEAAINAAEVAQLREELAELRQQLRARAGGASGDDHRVSFGRGVIVRKHEIVDDVATFGGDAEILGTVRGDVSTFGGDIRIGPEGFIGGDAATFGGDVEVSEGGSIAGEIVGDEPSSTPSVLASWSGWFSQRLVFLLSFAGAGVLVVGLFPKRVGHVAATLEGHPVRSFVVGGVASLTLVFTSVLLAFTLIGLPIAALLLAVLAWGWLLGFVGLCQAVGDRLPFPHAHHGRWVAFLFGCLAITFVGALPWFGWIALAFGTLAGVGAAFRRG